jgi:predicted amidophosphoribosyltransferase
MSIHRLFTWLLPPRCGGCRVPGAWLCPSCWEHIRRLREPVCLRCGRELEFSRQPCNCRRRLRALSGLRAAVSYEGPVERAIHRFKYEGWRALAPMLAGLLADRLAVEAPPADIMLPVPLHPHRQRARGYNQAELLTHQLRRRFKLRSAPGTLLRARDTAGQVGLDRVQRRANVADAFAWKGPP